MLTQEYVNISEYSEILKLEKKERSAQLAQMLLEYKFRGSQITKLAPGGSGNNYDLYKRDCHVQLGEGNYQAKQLTEGDSNV